MQPVNQDTPTCSILNVPCASRSHKFSRPLRPSIQSLMPDLPHNSEHESLRAIVVEEKQEFTAPAASGSKLALAVRALRHRNFQLFFAGQLISLVGTWMQTVAESWLV